jgi:hypothetical protein
VIALTLCGAASASEPEYGFLKVYQDKYFETCEKDVYRNYDTIDYYDWNDIHEYNNRPGAGAVSGSCMGTDPHNGHPFMSVREYKESDQKSPYGKSCVCDKYQGNCLRVNYEMSNLEPYGIDYVGVLYKKGGCGHAVAPNGNMVGYLYREGLNSCVVAEYLLSQTGGQPASVDFRGSCHDYPERGVWYWEKSTGYIRNAEQPDSCLKAAELTVYGGSNSKITLEKCEDTKLFKFDYDASAHQFKSQHYSASCLDHIGGLVEMNKCSDSAEWELSWR